MIKEKLNVVVIFLIIWLVACDISDHTAHNHANDEPFENNNYSKAKGILNLFSDKINGQPISVTEARKKNRPGMELLIEGIIAGRKNPFTSNRASFILGDLNLKTCDKIAGDNCPTPWDACCEDRNRLLLSTINVQLLDNNGSLVHGSLDGVGGLKPGIKINVKGVVDKKSLEKSMVFNALKIEIN